VGETIAVVHALFAIWSPKASCRMRFGTGLFAKGPKRKSPVYADVEDVPNDNLVRRVTSSD